MMLEIKDSNQLLDKQLLDGLEEEATQGTVPFDV
jgi:hypothetical protein